MQDNFIGSRSEVFVMLILQWNIIELCCNSCVVTSCIFYFAESHCLLVFILSAIKAEVLSLLSVGDFKCVLKKDEVKDWNTSTLFMLLWRGKGIW